MFLLLLSFVGCTQRSCQRLQKQNQYSPREYTIQQYSGGKIIATHHFKGILNDSEGSDGYWYMQGDSLIEFSGDVIIRSKDL